MRYALLDVNNTVLRYRIFDDTPPVLASKKGLRWEASPEPIPKPPPLPTPEQIAAEAALEARRIADTIVINEVKADAVVQYLRDHSPAECAQYVENNVTNLDSAKAFLKKVAVVLSVLAKESLR